MSAEDKSRHEKYGDLWFNRSNMLYKIKAAEFRHNYIRQNKVDFIRLQKFNSLFSIGSLVYFIALCAQERSEILSDAQVTGVYKEGTLV